MTKRNTEKMNSSQQDSTIVVPPSSVDIATSSPIETSLSDQQHITSRQNHHHEQDQESGIPALSHNENILDDGFTKLIKNNQLIQYIPRIFRNIMKKCCGTSFSRLKPHELNSQTPTNSRRRLLLTIVISVLTLWLLYTMYSNNSPQALYPIYREDDGPIRKKLVGYIVKTNTLPSFYMRVLHPNQDIGFSKHMVKYGYWESATEELFGMLTASFLEEARKTRKKCLVVDIGSNLGYYSILPALQGCRVNSYEIQPNMVEILKSSASLNDIDKMISAKNLAVYKESGKFVEYTNKISDRTSVVLSGSESNEKTSSSVKSIKLDEDYFSQDIHINLLKVDVSKKTDEIFEGALRTLSYMIDNIIVELRAEDTISIKFILESFFDKVVVLEDSSGLFGYFFKSSTPKIFIGNEVSVEAITSYLSKTGKRNVWFSKRKKTIPYYGVY